MVIASNSPQDMQWIHNDFLSFDNNQANDVTFLVLQGSVIGDKVFYTIQIRQKEKLRFIQKRFNQFFYLRQSLKSMTTVFLPKLPRKLPKVFVDHANPAFIDQRIVLLNLFLNKISSLRRLLDSPPVQRFLLTDSIPDVSQNIRDNNIDYRLERKNALEYFESLEVSDVSIPATKQMKTHTLYQIHCFNGHPKYRTDANEWVSLKRFKDFDKLDRTLRMIFESNPKVHNRMPILPLKLPKTMVDHKEPSFVEERRVLLEHYLRKVILIPEVMEKGVILRFLNIRAM